MNLTTTEGICFKYAHISLGGAEGGSVGARALPSASCSALNADEVLWMPWIIFLMKKKLFYISFRDLPSLQAPYQLQCLYLVCERSQLFPSFEKGHMFSNVVPTIDLLRAPSLFQADRPFCLEKTVNVQLLF